MFRFQIGSEALRTRVYKGSERIISVKERTFPETAGVPLVRISALAQKIAMDAGSGEIPPEARRGQSPESA